jgi:hypothetical protein
MIQYFTHVRSLVAVLALPRHHVIEISSTVYAVINSNSTGQRRRISLPVRGAGYELVVPLSIYLS